MRSLCCAIAAASALTLLVSACGHTTTVTVFTVGPPPVGAVPFVVGLREPLAVQKLKSSGLRTEVTRRASTSIRRGIVLQQTPSAGNRIARGATVQLVVSNGKQ